MSSFSRRRLSSQHFFRRSGRQSGCQLPGPGTRQPALGRDHEVVGVGMQRLRDQLLAHFGPVGVGGVDEVDVQLDDAAQHRDRAVAVLRLSPDALAGDPHRAVAQAAHGHVPAERQLAGGGGGRSVGGGHGDRTERLSCAMDREAAERSPSAADEHPDRAPTHGSCARPSGESKWCACRCLRDEARSAEGDGRGEAQPRVRRPRQSTVASAVRRGYARSGPWRPARSAAQRLDGVAERSAMRSDLLGVAVGVVLDAPQLERRGRRARARTRPAGRRRTAARRCPG